MDMLVTAGNTLAPIDRVRCITNVFTGRTGAAIALHAHERGHTVTLLTSHPKVAQAAHQDAPARRALDAAAPITPSTSSGNCGPADPGRRLDAIDPLRRGQRLPPAGVYAPAPGTQFFARTAPGGRRRRRLVDRAAARSRATSRNCGCG